MKRTFLLLFVVLMAMQLFADNELNAIMLEKKGIGHYNYPIPADQPDVYYDSVNQEIIIDGTGYVSYYDVEIMSTSNWIVYVSTQVNGSYDTIDISSLPEGEYSITIDSPTGNSFEGFFDTY